MECLLVTQILELLTSTQIHNKEKIIMKNSLKNQIRTHVAMKNSDSLLSWAGFVLTLYPNCIDDISELKNVKDVVKELSACKRIDAQKFLTNWIPQMFITVFEKKDFRLGQTSKFYCLV